MTNLQGGSLGTKHTIQQLTYMNNHKFVKTYLDRFLRHSFKYFLIFSFWLCFLSLVQCSEADLPATCIQTGSVQGAGDGERGEEEE